MIGIAVPRQRLSRRRALSLTKRGITKGKARAVVDFIKSLREAKCSSPACDVPVTLMPDKGWRYMQPLLSDYRNQGFILPSLAATWTEDDLGKGDFICCSATVADVLPATA